MRQPGDLPTVFSGVNAEFLEDLYQQYLRQPDAFDADWQQFFASLPDGSGNGGAHPVEDGNHGSPATAALSSTTPSSTTLPSGTLPSASGALLEDEASLDKQSKVNQLINTYRSFGHTRANLDPLGRNHMKNPPDLSLAFFGLNEADLEESYSTGTVVAPPTATLRGILEQMQATYCGSVGAEFMFIRDHAQRRWLREAMEGSWNQPQFDRQTKLAILTKLAHAEMFEKYLHTKFVGQKRFSLEGAETLIVMMDALVEEAAELGVETVVLVARGHGGFLEPAAI